MNYLGLVCAGILTSLGFFYPLLWCIAPLGATLFFYALFQSISYKELFRGGFVFGTAQAGTALFWFWHALPLNWLGVTNPLTSFLVVLFSWSAVSATYGIVMGIGSCGFIQMSNWKGALANASLFTVTQYVQLGAFSLLTYGSGSVLGAHFSPTLLGYEFAWFSPLAQLASLGGVYFLTFLFFFYAAIGTHSIQKYGKAPSGAAYATLTIFLLILTIVDIRSPLVHTIAQQDETKHKVNIALLTTNNIPTTSKPDITKRAVRIAETRLKLNAWASRSTSTDILVLPEDTSVLTTNEEVTALRGHFADKKGPRVIIDSSITATSTEGRKMNMFAIEPTRTTIFNKTFLIPQGEYVPYLASFIPHYLSGHRFGGLLERTNLIHAGAKTHVLQSTPPLGALFCSEVLSPSLYRTLTYEGAELLLNSASHPIFHGSHILETHVLAIAKIRAIETGRYLAIASNASPSYLISNRGVIIASSHTLDEILEVTATALTHKTLYVLFGDWILICSFVYYCFYRFFFVRPALYVLIFVAILCGTPTYAHAITDISMAPEGFIPSSVQIPTGETVRFTTKGTGTHWIASNTYPAQKKYTELDRTECEEKIQKDNFIACVPVSEGGSFSYTFNKVGVWKFHDRLNPRLTGSVTVISEKIVTPRTPPEAKGLSFIRRLSATLQHWRFSVQKEKGATLLEQLNTIEVARNTTELEYWMRVFGYAPLFEKLVHDSENPSLRPDTKEGHALIGQCHTEAHFMGRMAFKLYGTVVVSEGLDTRCQFGFYHGVIESSLGNAGDDDAIRAYARTCSEKDNNPLRGIFCEHVIGHGLMVYYNYDLPLSLQKCTELLPTKRAERMCYHGAFMENIFASRGLGVKPHTTIWTDPTHPNFPCTSSKLPKEATVQQMCYFNQTLLWSESGSSINEKNIIKGCLNAPASVRDMCFAGFGFTIALPMNELSDAEVVQKCLESPTAHYQSECLTRALFMRATHWYTFTNFKNPTFCTALGYTDLNVCDAKMHEKLSVLF